MNPRYKIALILNFELSSDEAQNAFLKTLEKPPQGQFFCFMPNLPISLLFNHCLDVRIVRLRPLGIQEVAKQVDLIS